MKYVLLFFLLKIGLFVHGQMNYPSYERSLILYKNSNIKMDFGGKIIYDMKFRITDDDTSKVKSERMELLYNDTVSVFQNIRKGIKDSVLNKLFELNQELRIPSGLSLNLENLGLTSVLVFKRNDYVLVQDNYTNYLENFNQLFLYEEHMDLKWELTGDTLRILNYVCQKATVDYGGRKWEAWFSPQIPISDGPYKFSGLPGLILKINDIENRWQFECIAMEKTNRQIILMDSKDQEMKTVFKKEYFKVRHDYLSNQVYYDEKNLDAILIDNPPLKIKLDRFYRDRNKRLNLIERNVL